MFAYRLNHAALQKIKSIFKCLLMVIYKPEWQFCLSTENCDSTRFLLVIFTQLVLKFKLVTKDPNAILAYNRRITF